MAQIAEHECPLEGKSAGRGDENDEADARVQVYERRAYLYQILVLKTIPEQVSMTSKLLLQIR